MNTFFNPVNKSRLHEEIVEQIADKIISGELTEGTKLPPERDLAADLKVNRATVREALKKLEMLGLVEILHGDGIYIRDYHKSGSLELLKTIICAHGNINIGIFRNILALRKILVPEMAADAALKRNAREVMELERIAKHGTGSSIIEDDLALHHIIARATGNLVYVFILNFFNQLFRNYGPLYFADEKNAARSKKFHRDIWAAIRDKKPDRARSIMSDVLAYAEDRLITAYKTYSTGPGRGEDAV